MLDLKLKYFTGGHQVEKQNLLLAVLVYVTSDHNALIANGSFSSIRLTCDDNDVLKVVHCKYCYAVFSR